MNRTVTMRNMHITAVITQPQSSHVCCQHDTAYYSLRLEFRIAAKDMSCLRRAATDIHPNKFLKQVCQLLIKRISVNDYICIIITLIDYTLTKVEIVYENKKSFVKRIQNSIRQMNAYDVPRNSDVPYADCVFACARVLADMGVSCLWIRRNSRKQVVHSIYRVMRYNDTSDVGSSLVLDREQSPQPSSYWRNPNPHPDATTIVASSDPTRGQSRQDNIPNPNPDATTIVASSDLTRGQSRQDNIPEHDKDWVSRSSDDDAMSINMVSASDLIVPHKSNRLRSIRHHWVSRASRDDINVVSASDSDSADNAKRRLPNVTNEESSPHKRNRLVSSRELSLPDLIFQLNGDVALAKRVLRGKPDAIEQYFRLKWTEAEDEIVQVVFLQRAIE